MAKTVGSNEDSPKKPEVKQGDRLDVKLQEPGKYEISKDETFIVKLYLRQKDKRWIIMNGPGEETEEEEVVFRMWTYDELVELKKRATGYDNAKRIHMMDHDSLNRMKVQKFLMSWTLDKGNDRLKLHRVNNVLTDESWNSFAKLQPNISVRIIDEMNKIYELNG